MVVGAVVVFAGVVSKNSDRERGRCAADHRGRAAAAGAAAVAAVAAVRRRLDCCCCCCCSCCPRRVTATACCCCRCCCCCSTRGRRCWSLASRSPGVGCGASVAFAQPPRVARGAVAGAAVAGRLGCCLTAAAPTGRFSWPSSDEAGAGAAAGAVAAVAAPCTPPPPAKRADEMACLERDSVRAVIKRRTTSGLRRAPPWSSRRSSCASRRPNSAGASCAASASAALASAAGAACRCTATSASASAACVCLLG